MRRINAAFTDFPRASIACLLAAEMVSIYGVHALLVAAHVPVPAEFAVAFALSRTLRRARLPAELAGAAVLARAMPALRHVRVTALLDALPRFRPAAAERLAWLRRAGTAVRTTADRYGAAYFVSARYLGVGIVLTLYAAVTAGIDVAPYLERLGASPALGSALGSWAAAVTLASAVYPFSVIGAAWVAPSVGRAATRLWPAARRTP